MVKINPIKLAIALRALNPEWKADVDKRTKDAMGCLLAKKLYDENSGNGDVVGYGDLTTTVAVLTNMLTSVILSLYDNGKTPGIAAFSLLTIIETASEEFKKHGFGVDMVDMSDVNDAVEHLKKSAGFNK